MISDLQVILLRCTFTKGDNFADELVARKQLRLRAS
jgi:hypothetical protein